MVANDAQFLNPYSNQIIVFAVLYQSFTAKPTVKAHILLKTTQENHLKVTTKFQCVFVHIGIPKLEADQRQYFDLHHFWIILIC